MNTPTRRRQLRSPSDDRAGDRNTVQPDAMDDKQRGRSTGATQAAQASDDPQRGQGNKVTRSPRKRAPQAAAGKRHE